MMFSLVASALGRRPSLKRLGVPHVRHESGSFLKKSKAAFVYTGNESVPKNVTRVEIHPSVTHIRYGAFEKCTKLKEVVLNEGLRTIGEHAFYHCTNLKEVVLNDGLIIIGPKAFLMCPLKKVEIPSTVTSIGPYAFSHCKDLAIVAFNEGLQRIGRCAFGSCSSLESVEFPSTLEQIEGFAFHHCVKMKRVMIQEGLKTIENGVFRKCIALETVRLPQSLISIEPNSFRFCSKLKEVALNEGLRRIEAKAFEGCLSVQSIEFPSTLLEFGPQSFQSCQKLKYVSLNVSLNKEGIVTLGEDAFNACPSLKVLRFPSVSKHWEGISSKSRSEIRDKISQMPAMDLGETVGVRREAKMEEIAKSLNYFVAMLEWQESKEAIAIVGLALWKTKIKGANARDAVSREACRIEVPGPVKDLILQYLLPMHPCVRPTKQS